MLDHVTVLIGIAVGRVAVAGIIHQPYYNYRNPGPGQTIGRTFYGIVGMETPQYDGRISSVYIVSKWVGCWSHFF